MIGCPGASSAYNSVPLSTSWQFFFSPHPVWLLQLACRSLQRMRLVDRKVSSVPTPDRPADRPKYGVPYLSATSLDHTHSTPTTHIRTHYDVNRCALYIKAIAMNSSVLWTMNLEDHPAMDDNDNKRSHPNSTWI